MNTIRKWTLFAVALLLASCQSQPSAEQTIADLLRVYGVAAVQVIVGPELQARAPEMFRLLDVNSNGVLEEAELLSMDPASPVTAIVVVTTLQKLLKDR